MTSPDLHETLAVLLTELTDGTPAGDGFVLNPGDQGLLASLDRLSAADASQSAAGGATIAAHVAHVTYGISLMNRWADGEENPFATADWAAAWRTTGVDDEHWVALRQDLRREVGRWKTAIAVPRELSDIERGGIAGSVAHLAYHLGAIRQIAATARGPQQPLS